MLLNALVGEHLSIVTAKAQTTWQRVAGIRTEGQTQMIFLDTPGIVTSRSLFHRFLSEETARARRDADMTIGVVDGAVRPRAKDLGLLADFLRKVRGPAGLAVTKADAPGFNLEHLRIAEDRFGLSAFAVSAKVGTGLETFLTFVRSRLSEGPFLYPQDDVADLPTRFFVQELIRETIFEQYHQELPYSVAVHVEEFLEDEDPIYIAATLYAERKSQKGMLIGKGGSGIKALGGAARRKIERLLGKRVYLNLWIKVWEGWRRKKKGLMKFGYAAPDEKRS